MANHRILLRSLVVLAGWGLLLSATDLEAAWMDYSTEELTMTPPDWCPEADAMVLDKAIGYLVDFSGGDNLTGEHALRIKVFTEKGKRYGDFTLVEPYGQKIGKISARTILPDGRTAKVKPSQIFKKIIHTGANNEYRQRVYQWAFPDVQAGCILELHYSSRSEQVVFIDPYYFDYSGLPTRTSVLAFTFPEGAQYLGSVANGGSCNIQQNTETLLTTEGRKTRYSIGASRINVDVKEPMAPPKDYVRPCFYLVFSRYQVPGFNVNIMPDWKAAAKAALSRTRDFVRGGKQIETLVQSVTVPGDSLEAQARRLFRWVADSIELVDSKYCYDYDENAEAKLRTRKATGAEKVLILKALYDRLGIDSEPLLCVPSTESPGIKMVPALTQFRRMLLRLRFENRTFYLDPSETFSCFDLIPAEFEYALSLPLMESSDAPVTIPGSGITNRIEYDVNCVLDSAGNLHGNGTIQLRGQHYLNAFKPIALTDSGSQREYVVKRLLREMQVTDLTRLECDSVLRDSAVIQLSFEFNRRGYGTVLGDELLFMPNCLDRMLPDILPQDEHRTLPVHFDVPTHVLAEIHHALPAAYTCPLDSTRTRERLRGLADYSASVMPSPDGHGFTYSRSYRRDAEVVAAADYEKARQLFQAVARADSKDVIIRRGQ